MHAHDSEAGSARQSAPRGAGLTASLSRDTEERNKAQEHKRSRLVEILDAFPPRQNKEDHAAKQRPEEEVSSNEVVAHGMVGVVQHSGKVERDDIDRVHPTMVSRNSSRPMRPVAEKRLRHPPGGGEIAGDAGTIDDAAGNESAWPHCQQKRASTCTVAPQWLQ
jgi:hypothetical protein